MPPETSCHQPREKTSNEGVARTDGRDDLHLRNWNRQCTARLVKRYRVRTICDDHELSARFKNRPRPFVARRSRI